MKKKNKHRTDAIIEKIEALPVNERVFVKFALTNHSVEAIAYAMQISEDLVKKKTIAALEKVGLSKLIANYK